MIFILLIHNDEKVVPINEYLVWNWIYLVFVSDFRTRKILQRRDQKD